MFAYIFFTNADIKYANNMGVSVAILVLMTDTPNEVVLERFSDSFRYPLPFLLFFSLERQRNSVTARTAQTHISNSNYLSLLTNFIENYHYDN